MSPRRTVPRNSDLFLLFPTSYFLGIDDGTGRGRAATYRKSDPAVYFPRAFSSESISCATTSPNAVNPAAVSCTLRGSCV